MAKGKKKDKPAKSAPLEKKPTVKDTSVSIKWNDHPELSQLLISAITDNPEIKQGLFPSPGANVSTAKGGGNKKITWQWMLAEILFKDHKKYGAEFALAYKEKDKQRAWSEKIKNRINSYKMTKTTQKYIEELGETGAGITSMEEVDNVVDFSKTNNFTNLWREIKDSCPWFFDMRELIGERPNLILTGIGNSTSNIDVDILQEPGVATADAEVEDFDEDPGDADVSEGNLEIADPDASSASEGVLYDKVAREMDSSDSDHDEPEVIPVPTKITPTDSKTAPCPGSSKPATKQTKAKKSKLDDFDVTAQAEEVTRQKEIELSIVKVKAHAQIKIEAGKATIEAKVQLAKLKAEREKAKLDAKKELKLMKMKQQLELHRLQQANSTPTFSQPGTSQAVTRHIQHQGPSINTPQQHSQTSAAGLYQQAGPSGSSAAGSSRLSSPFPVTIDPFTEAYQGYGDLNQQTYNHQDTSSDDIY